MNKQYGSVELALGLLMVAFALFFLFVLGLGVARSGIFPIHYTYSEGERTGVVYKLSHKGVVCKTYEGQMNLGGMATDGNGQAVPNTWHFSAVDPQVVKQINQAAESGRRVTLEYVEYLSGGLCTAPTNYVIRAVK